MTRGKAALTEEQDFAGVAEELKRMRRPGKQPVSWFFVAFMGFLTLVFIGLGVWQMQRLAWKEGLIAHAEARVHQQPVAFPPSSEWVGLDPDVFDFRPVTLTGRFVPGNNVLVFTSLADPRGKFGGPGYWVMTPFAPDGGGTVLVNRGFIPEGARKLFESRGKGVNPPPEGEVTITGLARVSESVNPFTPGPDIAGRVEYVRNIDRLKTMMANGLQPFAEVYVDQAAGEPGVLPQGGETVVTFPNRHFEYALTWFSMAGMTVLMTGIWLWRRRNG